MKRRAYVLGAQVTYEPNLKIVVSIGQGSKEDM